MKNCAKRRKRVFARKNEFVKYGERNTLDDTYGGGRRHEGIDMVFSGPKSDLESFRHLEAFAFREEETAAFLLITDNFKQYPQYEQIAKM